MKVHFAKLGKRLKTLGLLGVISVHMLLGTQLLAAEATENDDSFQIGGSCAGLAYVSSASLRSLIAGGFADDFHSFCFPEEPSECSDYTSFLKGVGRLSTGEDGYHCSLQLH